ncbi:mannonate oxidoreductase [Anaerocolumna aminovalerica]|uniref:DsDNA-specific endonuclease/ATPase MutS2 n=1 Tax=Anaerocolumna aminovalerica TaxID=1527 RepID=A0A1I5BRJ0_9FIRM|nr:DNA mismatch repair protein MutS [Anaerocolumna aminovalerica]MDU6264434.1 DNA mismatch repair protein MutS [Anaerocolumna aminovalerica]SFN77316.1 dsDNA-specific endonuclease/ATPase MutS2 [Anaerocolumna aminovalerica]
MNHSFQILEFHKILNKLEEYAYTEKAKEEIRNLEPFMAERDVLAKQRETTEARIILDKIGNPPLVSLSGVEELLVIAEKEGCLAAEQLEYIAITLTAVRRLKDFLCRCKVLELSLPYYEVELDSLDELREELNNKIRNNRVDDYASKLLKDLRSDIERLDNKMRMKAESILKANKDSLSDQFITIRNGRICLPVKKDCKFKINGSVIDKSSTGATLFIEPTAVASLNEELQELKIEEENEERRILYTLTSMVAEKIEVFLQNTGIMEKLDYIFAKGRLSVELDGKAPHINTDRIIKIVNGKHPLMDKDICVPLNFNLGGNTNGVIITGPNTGGKTVAIKTVGLHCLMAQCGLHIPCDEGDICLNSQVLCDIGDGQNISENLSTFSAHITNVLDILKKAGRDSLVIMDELGSGTDPTEGMGIAIAILEELRKSNCLFLVTTHYPEVKNYGEKTENILNARMTFDRETLKPLYQLEIGKAGESCALYIAKRLGMPGGMLRRASMAAYGKEELEFLDLSKEDEVQRESAPIIYKVKEKKNQQNITEKFNLGDSVMVLPDKRIGIVCERVNDKGVLRVQLPDKKIWINHKRVKLHVAAKELYPEDYDFSIIFDTVENRKARHSMERKYCGDLEIKYED